MTLRDNGINDLQTSAWQVRGTEPDWTDANGKVHRYQCGLNPDPYAVKHMVNFCTCPDPSLAAAGSRSNLVHKGT